MTDNGKIQDRVDHPPNSYDEHRTSSAVIDVAPTAPPPEILEKSPAAQHEAYLQGDAQGWGA